MTKPNWAFEPDLIAEVAVLAQQYCAIIDGVSDDRSQWLQEVADLLPRLHAAIASVDSDYGYVDHLDPVDLDARFELFTRLRRVLGERDSYWLEFDRASEGTGSMTGSLADDLTDIYCELKQGLRLFELDPECASAAWLNGYEQHWGQHLTDAERHLAALGIEARPST